MSAVFIKGGLYMGDRVLKRCSCEKDRGMRYSPYRFQRGWIIRQSGNDMPMDMGELIPQEFIVDLLGLVDLGQDIGDSADFFNQLYTFG